jgi:DNA-binding NarL/FixJ family response regulator
MIRIALAEELRIERWALAEALGEMPELEVVGEAGTLDGAIEMLLRAKPDVLVLDPSLPDHGGADALTAIRQLEAGPFVIALAPSADPAFAARAIKAGAHAYVAKSADPGELLAAIHAVIRGDQIVPPGVESLLAADDGHPARALTRRELQVMELLARGMTNREIAIDLEIAIKTVDTHRGHVLKKLHLRNNAELVRFALKHGYVAL